MTSSEQTACPPAENLSAAASTVHDTATKNFVRSKMQTKELADSSAYNDADDDDDNDDPSAQQQRH